MMRYRTTREDYKAAKRFDHEQFDRFCENVYAEGFRDGEASVRGADVEDVIGKIRGVSGIGEARIAKIREAIGELFGKADGAARTHEGQAATDAGAGAGTDEAKSLDAKAAEMRRAYKREWAKRNPDKIRAQQKRYWEKRAAEAAQADLPQE